MTEWVPSHCDSGNIPAREEYSVAKIGNSIFLFGGKKSNSIMCDLYEIVIESRSNNDNMFEKSAHYSIKKVQKLSDEATWPTPRYGSACCVFDNKMVIHGGRNGNIIYNDMYFFDPTTGLWEEVITHGATNVPLVHHAIASVNNRQIIMAGGEGYGNTLNPAVYRFDASKFFLFVNITMILSMC